MTHQGLVCRIVIVLTIFGGAWTAPLRADGLITTHRLSWQMASEAAVEVVASCAKQGYAETAVVVDADGVRQAVLRGDGTGSHSLDSAYDKAYTAATFKNDTLALIERAKTAPGFSGLFAQLPHLILVGGDVPTHPAAIWMTYAQRLGWIGFVIGCARGGTGPRPSDDLNRSFRMV